MLPAGRSAAELEKQCRFAGLQGVAGRQSYWNLFGLKEQEEKVFEQKAPKTEVQVPKVGRALEVQLAVLNRWKSTGCRRSKIRVLTLCASTLQKVFRCLHQQKVLPTVTQEKRGVGGDPETRGWCRRPRTQWGALL